jgi:hypothetical protein
MTYTMPAWAVSLAVKAARQANHRAIGWKRKVKEALEARDMHTVQFRTAQYMAERNYVRGIMQTLSSLESEA